MTPSDTFVDMKAMLSFGRCKAVSSPHPGSRQANVRRSVCVNYKGNGKYESILESNIRLSSVPVIDAAEFMHQVNEFDVLGFGRNHSLGYVVAWMLWLPACQPG